MARRADQSLSSGCPADSFAVSPFLALGCRKSGRRGGRRADRTGFNPELGAASGQSPSVLQTLLIVARESATPMSTLWGCREVRQGAHEVPGPTLVIQAGGQRGGSQSPGQGQEGAAPPPGTPAQALGGSSGNPLGPRQGRESPGQFSCFPRGHSGETSVCPLEPSTGGRDPGPQARQGGLEGVPGPGHARQTIGHTGPGGNFREVHNGCATSPPLLTTKSV